MGVDGPCSDITLNMWDMRSKFVYTTLAEITKRNENMKDAKDCVNMTEIRTAIDIIDNQIVELIASRSKYVKKAAKDSNRVQKVINSKKELAEKYGASPELIEKIYKMMIDFFINEEMKEWKSK
jgi:isochorismate pyruvate lyase